MSIDPRTPVIIGVGQVSHRPDADADPAQLPDAIDLMAEALAAAETDSGASVLPSLHTVAVVGGLWRHQDPGRLVAEQMGFDPSHTVLTTFGGNLPIHLTHTMAERIRSGEIDAAAVLGGEANLTRRHLKKQGQSARTRTEPASTDVESWGPPIEMGDELAVERGGEFPRNSYAILDSAIRAERGETIDVGRARAAATWAGFAKVAADNPHAADRSAMTADAILEPDVDNRMVSWPYTKAMCANNTVNQAGAILLCSVEVAERLGVAPEHWVFPHHCAVSTDTPSLLEREQLFRAPALTAALACAVDAAGGTEAIDHYDLYSCFPSIVALTTDALGISPDRELTVSGGLAFAGAPLNFAAGMGLISMVDRLRRDPGSTGLVQGNGGHATKHAIGLYSTSAPTAPHHIEEAASLAPKVALATRDHAGDATIEGITVEFEHDGPTRAVAIVRFDDGQRTWATSTDAAVLSQAVEQELVGTTARVDAGVLQLAG